MWCCRFAVAGREGARIEEGADSELDGVLKSETALRGPGREDARRLIVQVQVVENHEAAAGRHLGCVHETPVRRMRTVPEGRRLLRFHASGRCPGHRRRVPGQLLAATRPGTGRSWSALPRVDPATSARERRTEKRDVAVERGRHQRGRRAGHVLEVNTEEAFDRLTLEAPSPGGAPVEGRPRHLSNEPRTKRHPCQRRRSRRRAVRRRTRRRSTTFEHHSPGAPASLKVNIVTVTVRGCCFEL
jgi:hypothetical protein